MADLAVIMGATGGLGSAIVDAFASRGDRVIAVARSRAEVSQLASKYPLSPSPSGGGQGGGVTGDTADLTSRLAVDDLWERIDREGTPRWVVNATGGYRAGKVVDTTPDDFSFMMDLNLGTAWWSCRAAARRMQSVPTASGGGCIVNVSSRSALVAEPGAAAYAVAKSGVIKLTEVLADLTGLTGRRIIEAIVKGERDPGNLAALPDAKCKNDAGTIAKAYRVTDIPAHPGEVLEDLRALRAAAS